MSEIYDVIILGAGPAGLAAGLYAGRSRLNVLIIEKGQDGGQIAITDEIENYPGQIVEGESGPSLIARMTEQAEKFGAKRVSDMIKEVELEGEVKVLKSEKNEYRGKNVIIATGAHARPIGCKGEGQFRGKGVSYCATCDANFFEDFEVYVVGGGDSAVEEAMYLTKFARKVTIIHRRDELRAAKSILFHGSQIFFNADKGAVTVDRYLMDTPDKGDGSLTGYNVWKWIDYDNYNYPYAGAGSPDFSTNWIILRYAEIYLNDAEARLETGDVEGARKAVNMIRQRVGLPDLTESDPEKLRELIRKERRIEFAFEEQRFYDVRRWKIGPETQGIIGRKRAQAAS